MPNTLSIENINLNGGILTTNGSTLYINNHPVQIESGLPINDKLFIKGYAPLSFYSRLAIHGTYLNEVFLNDDFIATGWLLTCTQPGTGSNDFKGRFYSRKISSVIDTQTVSTFQMSTGLISEFSDPFFNKIYKDKIIGIDIYSVPYEMESISINLLGYFAGAGHFDRVPKIVNYYKNGNLNTGENIYEEFIQYNSTFTGINIFAGASGTGASIAPEKILGYISGVLQKDPIYKLTSNGDTKYSGYYISNERKIFPDGATFSGFSGQSGFYEYSGFSYSGFSISPLSGSFSGFNNTNYGYGEFSQSIGSRNVGTQEKIIGFRSGYMNEFFSFSPFANSGNLSGYFLSGNKLYFQTGSLFSGFSGLGGFDSNLGFSYTGFSFPEGLGFSGITYANSGTGILTGYIGNRSFLKSEYITGFVTITSWHNFTPSSPAVTGTSGYFIESRVVRFDTGNNFSGFSGQSGFYQNYGYAFEGLFASSSGFSGLYSMLSGSGIMTGVIGYRNIPYMWPMSGRFYYKDQNNIKTLGQPFSIDSGKYSNINIPISYGIENGKRVGIDIYNTLPGLSNVNIALVGYYD